MNARAEVLARIRAANADAGAGRGGDVPRGYASRGSHGAGSDEVLALLEDRLVDYRAMVTRTAPDRIALAVAQALGQALRVVVPPGLPSDWLGAQLEAVVDDDLSPAALDQLDGVVTAATAACAVTGTIVLDGSSDQGRRAITLVPDLHVCVVRAGQVVETVPELLEIVEPTRPLTFISGPSATSDIELERVEGVHGPRTLHVVLVTG